MDFEKLYTDILNLNSSIRYAAIQNNTGVKIAGGFRSEITPILSDEELQMMHYYASQRWQTRKNIEHKIGPAKYALSEYDKIKRITFPVDEKHLLMITTDINSDHSTMIQQILELIKDSKT